jgi:outer membrane beta-barrel protein
MDIRHQRIFLKAFASCVLLALMAGNIQAAEQNDSEKESGVQLFDPKVERRQVDEDDIDTEDWFIGGFGGILSIEDFGSSSVTGGRLSYLISENFFLEAQYGASEAGRTSYETLSGSVELLTPEQRQFEYYDLSIGYNLFPGEAFIGESWAFNTAFFIVAGAGNTDFAGDSHFTISYGAGYRFLATDWLDLNISMRNRTFDSDLLGEEKSTQNLSLDIGLNIFF